MSAVCTGYQSPEKGLVQGFSCPAAEGDSSAVYCCGFNDVKYCCDDPNSFFPYEYGYMWWLSIGALVGLSIAAVVLLVFIITVCVLCYLFIATKPGHRDNGLTLSVPVQLIVCMLNGFRALRIKGIESMVSVTVTKATFEPSHTTGPQGLCKHFYNRKLDCENRPADPERLFQRCFTATVTRVNVEGPTDQFLNCT